MSLSGHPWVLLGKLYALVAQHFVVLGGLLNLGWVFIAQHWAHAVGHKLQEKVYREGYEGYDDANYPLRCRESIDVNGNKATEKLGTADLHDDDYCPDN